MEWICSNLSISETNEINSSYYDHQACCISSLATIAIRGNNKAIKLIDKILTNTQYSIKSGDVLHWSLLYLAICYQKLKNKMDPKEDKKWQELLTTMVENILNGVNNFDVGGETPYNATVHTGINHVAVMAEGVWSASKILDRPDWQIPAEGFMDRLLKFQHKDGYYEEHTNEKREGGPSIHYSPTTAGCLFRFNKWRGMLDTERKQFIKCGEFYRNFIDQGFHCLTFADERTNIEAINPCGLSLHSLTPEGRGFLRMILDTESIVDDIVNIQPFISLWRLAVLDLEIENMELGKGEIPEFFSDGSYQLSLPIGVLRKNGWTLGLSALNRLPFTGDYALDRQSLLYLSHKDAGVILPGTKSKHDTSWSTIQVGADAYPERTGELRIEKESIRAKVFYKTFEVEISWDISKNPRLVVTSPSDKLITLQLPLNILIEETVQLGQNRIITFGEQKKILTDVSSVITDSWRMESNISGKIYWFISPFEPYTNENKSNQSERRPVFVVDFIKQVEVKFWVK